MENGTHVWRRIAGWWDAQIGEGNEFQLKLIMPATDRLLELRPGEVALDMACGNGNYARRMGRAGAKVVAVDVAEAFIARARERTTAADGEIEYRVVDATDERALRGLGEGRFDAVVCSMAMMDLPDLAPLLRAVKDILKPGGRFVFSLPHPCFSSNQARMTAELVQGEGKIEQRVGVACEKYITPFCDLSVGIMNQPEPHPLWHRPLSEVLGQCFAAGFGVDGLLEPTFSAADAKGAHLLSWKRRVEIPPAVVVRVRVCWRGDV